MSKLAGNRSGYGRRFGQALRHSWGFAGVFCHVGKTKHFATPRPESRNDRIQKRRWTRAAWSATFQQPEHVLTELRAAGLVTEPIHVDTEGNPACVRDC